MHAPDDRHCCAICGYSREGISSYSERYESIVERKEPEIRSSLNELEGNYLLVMKPDAVRVVILCENVLLPFAVPQAHHLPVCYHSSKYNSTLQPPMYVELHLNDVVYIAQMFAKLVLSSERDFLAIASFNMTLEFRLESWGQMARIIMALKVILTAASNWAARHQADEAGRLG